MNARWLVTRREIVERARSRTLQVATAVQLALIVIVLVIAALVGGGDATRTVGLVGDGSQPYAQPLRTAGPALDETVRTRTLPNRAAAVRAVRAGELDAAVIDGREVLVEDDRTGPLMGAIQSAHRQLALRTALTDAGVRDDRLQRALNPPALAVRALDPRPADAGTREGLALIAVILLYIAILTYGLAVANGVIEEKASRVIEVVLSAISPRELLFGKVVGIGLVAIAQFAVTVAVGLGAAVALDVADLPPVTTGAAVIAVAWFVAGFLLYASLYAIAGALVSRTEDLQSVSAPLNLIMLAAYLLTFFNIDDPDGPLAVVTSFVPLSAPMAMPARWLMGDVAAWEVAVSLALTLATAAAIVRLAAAIYAGTVLRLGPRVSLRSALSARGRAGSRSA